MIAYPYNASTWKAEVEKSSLSLYMKFEASLVYMTPFQTKKQSELSQYRIGSSTEVIISSSMGLPAKSLYPNETPP